MSKNMTDEPADAVESLVSLLDSFDDLPAAAGLRTLSYRLLGVAPGATVVDVGCGAGRAVAEMAELGATAVGVDVDERMVATARRRRPHADVRLGDACDLPFGDGELTGYRAEKVLHDLADPARALAEAARVLAPGGHAVLIGQDWDTFVIDSDDPELTRLMVHARAGTVPAPLAARRHRNLLLDAGFEDVAVEVRTGVFTDVTALPMLTGLAGAACSAGAVTRERADAWLAEQAERGRAGRLFLAVPLFVASGRRP
ncbi:methyltransferase domain-containing protein [Streptosporangium pseudovulgare]|nr:methyltransferase domain-containing protein [Streptosporangium pseudovulgare]